LAKGKFSLENAILGLKSDHTNDGILPGRSAITLPKSHVSMDIGYAWRSWSAFLTFSDSQMTIIAKSVELSFAKTAIFVGG
jgi:hypothetical protein